MLIDTHAHLFWDSYKQDFDQVIKNAEDAAVNIIINVGVDIKTSKICAELDSLNPNVTFYSSIAIHPEEAVKYFNNEEQIQKDIDQLEQIYHQYPEKVVAVGECGLDFSYATWEGYLPEHISKEHMIKLQRKLFQAQIDLPKKLDLPLLLHVRDDRSENPNNTECWSEAIELTKDHFGIYHCYSGLESTTKNLSPNFLVSFAGNSTYKKNEYLRDAITFLPLEKMVLETDCPFLPPQSIRGKRNEPSSVKEIAELIAELKQLPFEQVAQVTTSNFLKLIKKQ